MRRIRGFTLIELLVVIAIIAVLAAILFPVFAAAKSASKKTAALSNISQLGKGMSLYVNDHDDHLPFRFPIETKWFGYNKILIMIGNDHSFRELYEPYVKNKDVWFSPEDRLTDKGNSSFAVNEQLAFDWSLSAIARPSEAIYLTDRTDIPTGQPPADVYVWWQFVDAMPFPEAGLPGKIDPIAVATQIAPIRYTGNVATYLFLDGHASALPFGRTWGDANHNLHLALKS